MKRIGVTGASGFIGTALARALHARGDAIVALTRHPQKIDLPSSVEVRRVDLVGDDVVQIAAAVDGLDAVVHLAGETVAGRWTAQKKRAIRDSRTVSTRNLVAAMRASARPPRVLVCASASGYYGSRGDEALLEDSKPGEGFLAQVCVDWEKEARRAEESGTRVVRLRQGLVLGAHGGALKQMLPAFNLGAGGALGSGKQWWPWIHLADDIALIAFVLDHDEASGAINACSPDIATNARFGQALGHALHRPSLAIAPGPALRVLLGEFAGSLLSSQLMLPARASDLGFAWQHESLERALLDLIDPGGQREPATTRFESAEKIAAGRMETFEFFSRVGTLAALTPPEYEFRIVTQPDALRRGATLEYTVKVHGVRVRWKSLIARWEPGVRFVDYQLRGPYLLWRHEHGFEPQADGVLVRDTIDYALPAAPLSNPALPMVRDDVRRIFDYRRARLNQLLLPKTVAG